MRKEDHVYVKMTNRFRFLLACMTAVLVLSMILTVLPGVSADDTSGDASDEDRADYKKKIVAVVYDNSGSMSSDPSDVRTPYAKYAMASLIGALYDEDELYIVPMNPRNKHEYYRVDLTKDRTEAYNDAEKEGLFRDSADIPNGEFNGTPPKSVTTAQQLLIQHGMKTRDEAVTSGESDAEYWLIIMTDGEFTDSPNVIDVVRRATEGGYSDVHVDYLAIGSEAKPISASDKAMLQQEMVFYSHTAADKTQIVSEMEDILAEMSGRYKVPASAIAKSGKTVTVDLDRFGFSASSVCVIMQNCGRRLTGVTYNGKSITPATQSVLDTAAISGLASGYTALMRGTFTGGKMVLTFDGPLDASSVTVLAEPMIQIKAYAEYKGARIDRLGIRHTLKPGDQLVVKYQVVDKLTGSELRLDSIFSSIDDFVTYAQKRYDVGEPIPMVKGINDATVYVSCMGGALKMSSVLYCNIHENPNDFGLSLGTPESRYQGDYKKTRVPLTIICNSNPATVPGLLGNHYTEPKVEARDPNDRIVPGIASLITGTDGKAAVVLDLNALVSPAEYYTISVSSSTDSSVSRKESDEIGDSIRIDTFSVTPRDILIDGEGSAVSGSTTEVEAVFRLSHKGASLDVSDLVGFGFDYRIEATSSSGQKLTTGTPTVSGNTVRVRVDTASTPDLSCTVKMTVSDGTVKNEKSVKADAAFAEVSIGGGTSTSASLKITGSASPVAGSLTQGVAAFTVTYFDKAIGWDELKTLGLTYTLKLKDKSGQTLKPIDTKENGNVLKVTADTAGTIDGCCTVTVELNGRGISKTCDVDVSSGFSFDKLKVTASAALSGSSLTEKQLTFTFTYDGQPLDPSILKTVGCTWTVTGYDADNKVLSSVKTKELADGILTTLDLAGTPDGWGRSVMTVSGFGKQLTCEGSAAVALKNADIRVDVRNTSASDAPLGVYDVDVTILVDGKALTKDQLKALWLTWEITSPDAALTDAADALSAAVDVTGASSVNTSALVTVRSMTREDAGAVAAEGSVSLTRPAIDPARIRVEAGVPVNDDDSHYISYIDYTVCLDDEPLTAGRMKYLGLTGAVTARVKADNSPFQIDAPSFDENGMVRAKIDTENYKHEEYLMDFTLTDDVAGQTIGSASVLVTRYGFWLKCESMTDRDGDGTAVTLIIRLFNHDKVVDKTGLADYTLKSSCVDPGGMVYETTQTIGDDGTITVTINTREGGQSRLGRYVFTMTAENDRGQTPDGNVSVSWERVPLSWTVTPENIGRDSMNPWQFRDNTEEWAFTLMMEDEPYPFNGTWAKTTVTFNNIDVTDAVRMEENRLILTPSALLLTGKADQIVDCGAYVLRIEVKSAVEDGRSMTGGSAEHTMNIIEATYRISALDSDDKTLDRFPTVWKRKDNTAQLVYSVVRDGEVLGADELKTLYESGAISIEHEKFKNLLFWIFFSGEASVEEQNGEGVIRYTVTRTSFPDALHFVRCFLSGKDKNVTVACDGVDCTAAVTMQADPWYAYLIRALIAVAAAYLCIWFIGLFTFRKRFRRGYFLVIKADPDDETVRMPEPTKINQNFWAKWGWSITTIYRALINPKLLFASQTLGGSYQGVSLTWKNGNQKVIVKKGGMLKTTSGPAGIDEYDKLVKTIKQRRPKDAKKNIKNISAYAFLSSLSTDSGECLKKDRTFGCGQTFAILSKDEYDGSMTVVGMVRYIISK